MRNWTAIRTGTVGPLLSAAAAVLVATLPALAQQAPPFGPRPFGPHPFGPHPFGPHPYAPWVFVAAGTFLALRLLLVIGLVIVVWRLLGAAGRWHRPDSATQVLRERYARGEISEEEYRQRLSTLA
jgi:putative membrane protein